MYANAQKRQENLLGDISTFHIPKMTQSGTITTKFDVQEIEGGNNYVICFKTI